MKANISPSTNLMTQQKENKKELQEQYLVVAVSFELIIVRQPLKSTWIVSEKHNEKINCICLQTTHASGLHVTIQARSTVSAKLFILPTVNWHQLSLHPPSELNL